MFEGMSGLGDYVYFKVYVFFYYILVLFEIFSFD